MANEGLAQAGKYTVVNPADRQILSNVNTPKGVSINRFKSNIDTLNKFDVKCLLVQLANIESNNKLDYTTVGSPNIGIFKANINANTVVSHWNTYYANVATVTISNSDHSNIKLGMVANTTVGSQGAFGDNTVVVAKSVGGNITAGNFIPGCTYTITSLGTTDFTAIGANTSIIGNVFVANAVGTGTGTAQGSNNEIILSSNHTVSGDVVFFVSPLKLGRYQNTQWLLTHYGYIDDTGEWTSKDGIDTSELFLSSTQIQNKIMYQFVQDNYIKLIQSDAIRAGDSKAVIAGMLAVAYQYHDVENPAYKNNIFNKDGTINLETYSNATKAKIWRDTGQTADSYNRPGHVYFNGGKYAVTNLGADVPD